MNGGLIGVENTSKSGVWTQGDVSNDVNSIRSDRSNINEGDYENVFIMGVSSEGGWHRIDKDGNTITVSGSVNKTTGTHSYFDDKPIYRDIVTKSVTSDGGTQTMVEYKKFWYKRVGTGLSNDPYMLWIADGPATGFSVQPAFALKDTFQVGAYTCNGDGYDSVAGAMPKVNVSMETAQTAIPAAHGTDWRLWDIYQLSAIQMLFLVEFGDPDAQTLIGQGNLSSSAVVGGASDAVYRGIHELWANVWQGVDGFRGVSGTTQAEIFDTQGNHTYVATGVTPLGGSDSAITAMDTDDDLLPVNIPKAGGTISFGDKYWGPTISFVMYHGGYLFNGSSGGVFCVTLGSTASHTSPDCGFRLAKV